MGYSLVESSSLLIALAGALAGVAVTAGVLLTLRRAARRSGPVMRALAAEAVRLAREEHATELDFSPASVEAVEAILAKLHAAGPKDDGDTRRQALVWGAYVGEVLVRHKGGRWERDHEVAGPGSFPVHWEDHQSFPVAWCHKRLVNGDEDNVWHKYQVLTRRV